MAQRVTARQQRAMAQRVTARQQRAMVQRVTARQLRAMAQRITTKVPQNQCAAPSAPCWVCVSVRAHQCIAGVRQEGEVATKAIQTAP